MISFKGFEKKIGILFRNVNLLQEALTHRSYLNENPTWGVGHNERLEYLGDAVLELVVTEFLYQNYPNYQEGQMTSLRAALVNYQMLSRVGKEVSLEESIFLSRGEAKDIGKAREVILANAFEALVGAIYLDQGYETVKKFITKVLLGHLNDIIEQGLFLDAKSLLQEIVQEKLKVTPTYKVLEEQGPDHQKEFLVGVFFDDTLMARGEGSSKQEAEREAAEAALKKLENR